jgi:hypothetical protein
MALKPGTVTTKRAHPRALAACYRAAADRRRSAGRSPSGTRADDHGVKLFPAGATVLDVDQVSGPRWTVLTAPVGNEFCVGN